MLLKNFGSLLAGSIADGNVNISGNIKSTAGNKQTWSQPNFAKLGYESIAGNKYSSIQTNYNSTLTSNSSVPQLAIILGDGTTEPTPDDYALSGNLITDVSGYTTTSSSIFEINASSNGVTVSGELRNTGAEPVTIREIALVQAGFDLSAGGTPMIMLTRDVLPQPVVLEAGAGRVFEVFIDTQSFVANASQA